MKKFTRITFVTLLCVVNFAVAQAQAVGEEAIVSFDTTVTVRTDNSVDVEERIAYQTGGLQKHGIYRDIYPYSSQDRKMQIENVSVADEQGVSVPFVIQSVGRNVRLKIGDPNITFVGDKIYVIQYRATKAVAKLDEVDEIYWNATGNDWDFPIYHAEARVVLPSGVFATQQACYQGEGGSTEKCQAIKDADGSSVVFYSERTLSSGEGVTVAVGFPVGTTEGYPFSDRIIDLFKRFALTIIAILAPLITFIVLYKKWYKNGRDPKGSGVIVPQYDVPDNVTPMETATIVDENVSARSISAEIVYLATRGYLKIIQKETKTLGLFETTDYELVRSSMTEGDLKAYDRELLQKLFANRDVVRISDLRTKFYKHVTPIVKDMLDGLIQSEHYKNLGRLKYSNSLNPVAAMALTVTFSILALAPFAIFLAVFLSAMFEVSLGDIVIVAVGSILTFMSVTVFNYLSPAKTEKGVATKEHLLGLKMYLEIAEKDRLEFHNAPEKKPEVFERLLPYAMVFGVEKAWAKEFQDIYTTPPSWYEGSYSGTFNSLALGSALTSFGSTTGSSLLATPSSSSSGGFGGSGGGGFSGGGGGGGGGGSW